MTDRKKPGVAFWATVGLVVVLVGYPLSIGPVCRLLLQFGSPKWALDAYSRIYAPMVWAYENGPEPIRDAIDGTVASGNDESPLTSPSQPFRRDQSVAFPPPRHRGYDPGHCRPGDPHEEH